jgi:hypothetical protein
MMARLCDLARQAERERDKGDYAPLHSVTSVGNSADELALALIS